jgi:cell division protein FtsI/penicillin-binding protein 2
MKNHRFYIFLSLVFLLAAIIFGRLFYIQIINGKFYRSQALGQQAGFEEIKGNRGEVFFENSKESHGETGSGEIKSLAINNDTWQIFAIPNKIPDKEVFADTLSKNIKETKEYILSKLEESDSYVIIEKGLPADAITPLKKLNLAGLFWEDVTGRYYPQETLASQVIGFMGGAGSGQYGIEGYYEDVLQGKEGIKEVKSGLNLIGSSTGQDNLDGSDLYLTIDYNIQFQAEALLAQAEKDISIDSGQIIVMKPDTGRILAMANFPAFNPNSYYQEKNLDIFQNVVLQKVYEPGSVFKPFTMAMALNEGAVTPDTTFVDTGSVTIGRDTVYNFNHEKYGKKDMSGILEKSINTGAVFLEKSISHETFLNYLDKFGFNEKTGIDLQGEVYAKNENLKTGSDFGFATASFGQGINMTPIQLVSAFSIFANGGKMVKPYIVEKIVNADGETVTKPEVSSPVISAKTATEVTKMMINVVERGFGDGARIKGYYLAGKTGTAEVPFKDKKGYYPDRTIQSFIGFGPALNPQFLILVKLDHPNVPKSALSAVPIFKKLAQFIINYWQIPPDYQ